LSSKVIDYISQERMSGSMNLSVLWGTGFFCFHGPQAILKLPDFFLDTPNCI